MDALRVIAATILFAVSSYLVYDLAIAGFDWMTLTFCLCGFLSTHYLWPRSVAGESHWYNILELVVDLPYRAIALFPRSIGRLRRNKGDGFDIVL
jgi:hypothetical protein